MNNKVKLTRLFFFCLIGTVAILILGAVSMSLVSNMNSPNGVGSDWNLGITIGILWSTGIASVLGYIGGLTLGIVSSVNRSLNPLWLAIHAILPIITVFIIIK